MLNEKQQAEHRYFWETCSEFSGSDGLSVQTGDLHDGTIIPVWCYYFDENGELSGSSMGIGNLLNAKEGIVNVFHRQCYYTPNDPKISEPILTQAVLGAPKKFEKKFRIYYYMTNSEPEYTASMMDTFMRVK